MPGYRKSGWRFRWGSMDQYLQETSGDLQLIARKPVHEGRSMWACESCGHSSYGEGFETLYDPESGVPDDCRCTHCGSLHTGEVGETLHELVKWRQAVIERLIVSCIFTDRHEYNPELALDDLYRWETSIALDPQVSSDAQKLIQLGYDQWKNATGWVARHGTNILHLSKHDGWELEIVTGGGPSKTLNV